MTARKKLTKKQLDKFKMMLLMEQQTIAKHLVDLKDVSQSQLERGPGDDVDIASTEISQAAIQKLGNREQKHLKKVQDSLKKIEEGEYGMCEECGEPIGLKRLEARPIALFCIDCKSELEGKERHYVDDNSTNSPSQSNWNAGSD